MISYWQTATQKYWIIGKEILNDVRQFVPMSGAPKSDISYIVTLGICHNIVQQMTTVEDSPEGNQSPADSPDPVCSLLETDLLDSLTVQAGLLCSLHP